MRRLFFFLAWMVGTFANTYWARADCDDGAYYRLYQKENSYTVEVCVGTDCPFRPVVRQNVETDELVQLSSFCDGPDGCYQDECVAPGTYRYGLTQPFTCDEAVCDGEIDYYAEITVADQTANGVEFDECELNPDNSGVVHYNQPLPWEGKENGESCQVDNGACSVVTPGAMSVLSLNGLVFLISLLMIYWRR